MAVSKVQSSFFFFFLLKRFFFNSVYKREIKSLAGLALFLGFTDSRLNWDYFQYWVQFVFAPRAFCIARLPQKSVYFILLLILLLFFLRLGFLANFKSRRHSRLEMKSRSVAGTIHLCFFRDIANKWTHQLMKTDESREMNISRTWGPLQYFVLVHVNSFHKRQRSSLVKWEPLCAGKKIVTWRYILDYSSKKVGNTYF